MSGRWAVGAVVAALVVSMLAGAVALFGRAARSPSATTTGQLVAAHERLGAPCDSAAPVAPAPVARTIALHVLAGQGVSDGEIDAQLRAVASYYAPYGVGFQRAGEVVHLDLDAVLVGTDAEIEDALAARGIPSQGDAAKGTAPESRRAVCDVALPRLRALLDEHARPPIPGRIEVAMLRRVALPGSALAKLLPDLRGLTVSASAASPELSECLGGLGDHTPLVLLGLDAIAGRRPGTVDVTLAHEVGHTLGLEHVRGDDALMSVDPPRCVPTLSASELERVHREPR